MAEEEYPVKLYVYDISHGLASVYSQMVLGFQLDAVYHTSIVIYGNEYYFDRGIQKGIAGKTRFGVPMEVIDMGITYIPQDIFEEYLDEVKSKYHAASYDLFRNNCNHFSNEVSEFLNNTSVESRILHLPEQVLASSNGALIQSLFSGQFVP